MNILRYILAALLLLPPVSAFAVDPALAKMSPEQRLQRLENMLSADMMMEQSMLMDSLREEVSALRSIIEQQQFELDTIKQRQRSLYLDMDRRLMGLENGGSNSARSPVRPPGKATVPPPTPAARSTQDGGDDTRSAYSKAFDLLKEGRYTQSIEAFEDFLKKYPKSQYVDNAQYWLAEANYVSRKYKVALQEFQKLIASHPDSSKVPGARLKIGYVYYELKDWPEARKMLELVVGSYPDSTVSKKASERLARMKREGH